MISISLLEKYALEKPSDIAFKDRDISISWKEYYSMVSKGIVSFGTDPKHLNITRAIVLSKNRWELMILYTIFAALKIPTIGIDYTAGLEQIRHCFSETQANLVIYSNEFKNEIHQLQTELQLEAFSIDDDFLSLFTVDSQLIAELSKVIANYSERNYESISFTSGTSGFPKAVYRTKPFDQKRFDILTHMYGFDSSDVFLITLPFYHVSCLGWARLFLNKGGQVVLGDFENSRSLYQNILNENVTTTLIVPPALDKLLQENSDQPAPESLKFVIAGGKSFPSELRHRAISKLGPIIHEYYGTTETGINTLSNSVQMLNNAKGSGNVMEGSKFIILDSNNNPIDKHKVGRIAINSFQNAEGYLKKQLDTFTFDDEDYIKTADFGYFNDDDELVVISRSDLTKTSSAVNVYKLENQIRYIKGVEDVVITAENTVNGLNITIFIVYPTNILYASRNELIEIITELIGNDNHYLTINFVEEIPYSLSGKVKLRVLENKVVKEEVSI